MVLSHDETEARDVKVVRKLISDHPVTKQELPTDNRHPQGYAEINGILWK